MVDLEDSVPVPRKSEARRKAAAFFEPAAGQPVRRALRINSLTELDGLRDLIALRDYRPGPSILLIPKVESGRDLEIVERALGPDCPGLELLAIVETPRGFEQLSSIVSSSSRLRAVIFGSADYAAAVGIGLDWEPLVHVRSMLVNASRAAKLDAIDSPLFDLADLDLLRQEAERARALGFTGKAALHPRQVPIINEVFSPNAAEVEQARQILAAAAQSGQGITTVHGSMVGRPFFEASRQLLAEFEPELAGPASEVR